MQRIIAFTEVPMILPLWLQTSLLSNFLIAVFSFKKWCSWDYKSWTLFPFSTYRIAGYFRNRNFYTSSKIWIFKNLNFEKFIFRSLSGFRIIEKSVLQITRPYLPRTHLLVGMAYDGILIVVGWQSLISGNPALISGNLDEKKRHYDGPDWS